MPFRDGKNWQSPTPWQTFLADKLREHTNWRDSYTNILRWYFSMEAKMFLSETADSSLELSAGRGRPSQHNRRFMSQGRRTRHFALRTRFALRAKYRVRLAWFIKRLLCRPRKSLLIARLMPTYDHAPYFSFVYRSLYARSFKVLLLSACARDCPLYELILAVHPAGAV